jgi:hypothetical protein
MLMASTGQALAHLPQPLQASSSTTGRKLVVCTGMQRPNLRAAIMASQQQPQQLQMKLTRSRTFSPNWTSRVPGPVQQVQALGRVHRAGVAVP